MGFDDLSSRSRSWLFLTPGAKPYPMLGVFGATGLKKEGKKKGKKDS